MSFIKTSESQAAEDLMKTYGRFLRNFKDSIKDTRKEGETFFEIFQIKHDSWPENISIFQLLESENKVLSKILVVFFHLKQEAEKLQTNAAPIINRLLIIEDEIITTMESSESADDPTGSAVLKFSYSLEDLLNMKFLIQNSIFLSTNVIQQYCALFSMGDKILNVIPSTHYPSNLDDIALLLKNLFTFDTIFRSGIYKSYLQLYGEMMVVDEAKFGANEDSFRNLQNTLHELDLLLDGNIFQIAVDNIVATKTKMKAKASKTLENLMINYIKNLISSINLLDASNNISELSDTNEILKLNVMVVIYQKLFENLDPKNMRYVIEINNKFPAIVLYGNILFNGNEFLKKYLPTMEKMNVDIEKMQHNFLNNKIHSLFRDATYYSQQLFIWILHMQAHSKLGNENLTEKVLQMRCELFYQGLTLAGEMSFLIKTIINLHAKFGQLLSKSLASSIYKLIENLKMVKLTYQEHSTFISDSIAFVFQYLQFHTLNIIGLCQKKVMMDVKKEKKFDLSTTLVLITKLLYANVSPSNLNAISLAMNLTEPFKNFGNEYPLRLMKLLDHMRTLCLLKENLEKVTDPSFLFWHQNLIGPYFKQLDSSIDQWRANFILRMTLKEDRLQALENVKNFHPMIQREFEENVVKKLCNTIEINLRLDFHSNLQVEKFNCFEINSSKIPMEDNRALVKLPSTTAINDAYVSIQNEVEFYLSKMFYNLTTISLKDWQSYEQMRRLAERKYEIDTVDDHLPTQTLEQGIDVLQIMRNIHLFVSNFHYNLNNQIFIEGASSNQATLHSIGIHNIANSLATHGFGIVNTTVNYVYQFLRKKFLIFSQFVYDERIKSRLTKEMKILREKGDDKAAEIFDFNRAHRLCRDIKKLDNQTLLDRIRTTITEIGNAIAYIRMIKSGISHVNSKPISYIPHDDDEYDLEFVSMCQSDELSKETIKAAEFLEKDIAQSMKKIQEGSFYFKKLISIFSTYFQSPKNSHMKNFYIFVPALTINYIEHILLAKDRLNKKGREEILFTDDGFAMGIVYILRLLNQIPEFNSLNWFKSVRNKIRDEKAKIAKQRIELEKSKGDNLLQTLLLSEKRIHAFEMEFELLFFSVNSCKIFFQN